MKQVWNDNDTTYLALWKLLVYHDHRSAGIGLLHDIFSGLVAEYSDKTYVPTQANLDQDTMRMEEALLIIGDSDGGKLAEWIEAYQADFDEFTNSFAWPWFDHCQNEDVFALFN